MAVSGIQGQLLEITVVECRKLKDTEWISRQDPYVCLEYGSTKFRTRTCTDGGKNPKFQEKFLFTLIEGLREINVVVWNSNTLSSDDFIGSGKIQLQEVLSRGYCDQFWSLQTKSGRYAGEVKLIMHHQKPNKPEAPSNPNAAYSPFAAPSQPHVSPYSAPPAASAPHNPNPAYSSPPIAYPSKPSAYPDPTYSSPAPAYPNPAYSTPATAYPPMGSPYPNPAYPSPPSAYPPPPDPCMHPPPVYPHPAPYPASPYPAPSAYPASPYPPTSAYPYPPPPNASPYAPPGPYGMYPPPPPPY